MMASEKGNPLSRIEGSCHKRSIVVCEMVPLKSAIRNTPTSSVLRQVNPKRTTFSHGNLRGGAGIANSTAESKLLLMKHLHPACRDYNDCKSLPGLKRTAFPGGMLTSDPVRGLRPIPVLRGFTEKTPKPRNSMRSLAFNASFMQLNMVSTACSALVLLTPVRSTI